ncbi:N-acetylmuramoyl-L-alanine amidase [Ruminococcus difficilis]|uniref:N-acetylmuramoyl-L-alanine amidase n=1 Tax=Ruminococcus difficilis TaxID=2763069 RepID=A0A935C1X9_9FIRM|nr:N-acetylmuramoyl-L-alanine amidase [Ruminococcus difficilis]MBK6089009.1 N-acetylmuramoyl-L-alanine amidase [Ruminococcus difficilis]
MKVKTIYLMILAVILITFCLVMYSAFSNITARTAADSLEQQPMIVIDAGHGGEDGGAEVDGVLEKDINLSIAGKLSEILRLCGCRVTEIRDEDISVYDSDAQTLREKKVSDLKRRVEIANESGNNILVSIHQNKFDNSAYSGAQLFYSSNHDDSRVLAESIRGAITSLLQKDNTRELKPAGSDIYLLDHAEVPAVIVECGFLSNQQERSKLMDDDYQNEMAYAVAMGVLEYINAYDTR